jgi:hypothetical protein
VIAVVCCYAIDAYIAMKARQICHEELHRHAAPGPGGAASQIAARTGPWPTSKN